MKGKMDPRKAKMKGIQLFISIVLFFFFAGCSVFSPSKSKPERAHFDTQQDVTLKTIETESGKLSKSLKDLVDTIEKAPKDKKKVDPLMPVYNPLEDHIVSFSMIDEELQTILYTLAKSVGMNLIIEPGITAEEKLLTLNFDKVPASTVLKEILHIYDIYYEIDENVIRIKPFQERIFKLNLLDADVTTSFEIGGDVLGVGEAGSAAGLSGTFKLSGKGAKLGNPYDVIENVVQKVISKDGKYSLDRLAGSLYVKDTPAVISSISRIINHYKEMLSKQILLEARIIEVSLSDEFKFGIDWSVVSDESQSYASSASASWSLGSGLVLSHKNASISINPLGEAIEALKTFGDTKVISNPSIRCKHGQPAIISVGTSISYIKEEETTSYPDGSQRTDVSSIEVSTVFDGLILGVIPFIGTDGKITLLINPIKSDVDRASLELVGSISLPKVFVKEISTTIDLENHEVAILGGLIDKRQVMEDSRVPLLSAIPVLGYLFRSKTEMEETRELVIILGVSII